MTAKKEEEGELRKRLCLVCHKEVTNKNDFPVIVNEAKTGYILCGSDFRARGRTGTMTERYYNTYVGLFPRSEWWKS